MKIEIFGVRNKSVEHSYRNFARKVLKKISKKIPQNSTAINIIIVSDKYINKLNKQFLNRDRPTDVLSFPLEDAIFGEIYISKDRARLQAKEQKITQGLEICNLIAHGILHLANYSHDEMEKIQATLKFIKH